jgi:hypothetical protein
VLDLPKDENPNLLVLDTASRADEVSWSYLPTITLGGVAYHNATNNPGNTDPKGQGRGEFTNGLIAGLRAASTGTNLAVELLAGGSLLARMIERASLLGKHSDVAHSVGLTTPLTGGAYGGAPGGGTTPPAPATFTVEGTGWYQHFTGTSAVCVKFTTTPAQSVAKAVVHASGGTILSSPTYETRLDSRGEVVARIEIGSPATYTIQVDVTAGGKTVTQTVVVTVTSAPGTAPCPSS